MFCENLNCFSKKTGNKKRACYGYKGQNVRFCAEHKLTNMISFKSDACLKCNKRACFNFSGYTKGIYCLKHKLKNMINVKTKKCLNCDKQPVYNLPGKKAGLYCVKHKKDNMVNVKNKKCLKCNKQPVYNLPGKNTGLYCIDHKKDNMINVKAKKCLKCDKTPSYNYFDKKTPIYCLDHKEENMVNVKNKTCKTPLCDIRGVEKYKGYCSRCYRFTFPDEPISKNYKTKENDVFNFITSTFFNYKWISDKIVSDGCSKRRPDIFLDLYTHVIIIEIDENQHTDYDTTCENKRLMELSQDIAHRPMIMIRFNPDSYITKDGKKVSSCWYINKNNGNCEIRYLNKWLERLDVLGKEIAKWLEIGHDINKTIEVISLFYTEKDTENEKINYTKELLQVYTVTELKFLCKENGISGFSKKKKEILIEYILSKLI